MSVELYQEFSFDAAHRFPGAPHDYQRGLHGHSFIARIALRGEVDTRTGFLADLGQLETHCRRLRGELDHKFLNDIAGLENPSLERIAQWKARYPACDPQYAKEKQVNPYWFIKQLSAQLGGA